MAAAGRRVGLYDWLVTWPPRTLPGGFVIPGWLRRDERVTPPDLFARAGLTPYFYAVDRFRTRESWRENARRELREKPVRALADQCDLATAEAFARRLAPLHTVTTGADYAFVSTPLVLRAP